jgi:hypothetical protein
MWWVSLPGPDIVVADEAHLVKDKKTVVYEALGLSSRRSDELP